MRARGRRGLGGFGVSSQWTHACKLGVTDEAGVVRAGEEEEAIDVTAHVFSGTVVQQHRETLSWLLRVRWLLASRATVPPWQPAWLLQDRRPELVRAKLGWWSAKYQ